MPTQPGYLPLSIIRGIEFPDQVLRCADDNVTVTGTLTPDVTGAYVLSGTFNGHDLFILSGAPSYFMYFNSVAGTYIIAAQLNTGGFADLWALEPQSEFPSGTYTPGGAYTGMAVATDHTLDLTDYTVEDQVRRNSNADVTLDLNPSITDAANGEITIPGISSADTQNFDFIGTFQHDMVLKLAGERVGVIAKGPFVVSDNITQITPT